MKNIEYRIFRSGDEDQLADLYNRSFQMNGFSVVRTPTFIKWVYIQSPNFEPEMVQIAEDVENNKLVGAVYISLINNFPLNNKLYRVGQITDVSCHPDYVKQGIATSLMKNAIEYMKKKGYHFSLLSADYYGHARKKIYLRLKYKDITRTHYFATFPNIFKLIKDFPLYLLIVPSFLFFHFLTRLINNCKILLKKQLRNLTYEIKHNYISKDYIQLINKLTPKEYNGFPKYIEERFKWARNKNLIKRFRPTYILIKKHKKIIGGGIITHQNYYNFKIGLKYRIGTIHDLFLDKNQFKSKEEQKLAFYYLFKKIFKAAALRRIGCLIFFNSVKDSFLNSILRTSFFFKSDGPTMMLKGLNRKIYNSDFKKTLYILPSTIMGNP
jgi:predicted N-acetyltransferase YhbS